MGADCLVSLFSAWSTIGIGSGSGETEVLDDVPDESAVEVDAVGVGKVVVEEKGPE